MKDIPLTKAKLIAKIKALGKITTEQKHEIVCSLIGHSKIVDLCFGYVTCARCNQQIGDTLGGIFDLKTYVIVGHKCKECVANYKSLTWKDTYLTPDPFKKEPASPIL